MMKYLKRLSWLNRLQALMGMLIALTPFILKPVCAKLMDNGMPMPCHYSAIIVTILAVVLTLINLVIPFVNRRKFKLLINVVSMLLIAAIVLIPLQVIKFKLPGAPICGICRHDGMPCVGSFKLVRVFSLMAFIFAAVDLALSLIKRP